MGFDITVLASGKSRADFVDANGYVHILGWFDTEDEAHLWLWRWKREVFKKRNGIRYEESISKENL